MYAQLMELISNQLKKSCFSTIKRDVAKKAALFSAINKTLEKIIPQKAISSYNIVNCKDGCIIIEVNSLWLMWIKGNENMLLQQLNMEFGINKIKWRSNPNAKPNKIKARNNISISEKSATLLKSAAINMKHEKLKEALLKLARNAK